MTRAGQRALTIALLTPMLFLGIGSYEESAQQRAERIEKDCATSDTAVFWAELIVKDRILGSPSIRREDRRSRKIGDCEYMIFGSVVGENAFGAKIVNYYVIRMEGIRRTESVEWRNSPPIIDPDYSLLHQLYLRDPS